MPSDSLGTLVFLHTTYLGEIIMDHPQRGFNGKNATRLIRRGNFRQYRK